MYGVVERLTLAPGVFVKEDALRSFRGVVYPQM